MVDLIKATTTRTGLRVHAQLDSNRYPTKVQVSDQQLHTVPIMEHEFHGEWNYTIRPAPFTPDRSL